MRNDEDRMHDSTNSPREPNSTSSQPPDIATHYLQQSGKNISTIAWPLIEGIKQAIIIRGESSALPVLLYVHGGPGAPDFPYIHDVFKSMEKYFVVCYWEQRGAGKSYATLEDPETLTLEQLTEDAYAVSCYLIEKFQQSKIYILGHSWGTLLSCFVIKKYPHLFHAYLGIAQITNQLVSERESHDFVEKEARRRNDASVLKKIIENPVPSVDCAVEKWKTYLITERRLVFKYGGGMYGRNLLTYQLKRFIFCREYTLMDKIKFLKAAELSLLKLWPVILANNVNLLFGELHIPIYMFHGIHDRLVSYEQAKLYSDKLKAPFKKFYTFQDAGHFPHIESNQRFIQIVCADVLGLP